MVKAAGIPFRVPPRHLLPERLDAVLAVVYLIFNEGYGGQDDLAGEGLWLGSALADLLPGEPEVHGLLALMLLHDSRREARVRDGEIVLLADQDRSRWDDRQMAAGRLALDRALALGGRGPYVLQALIASLHASDDPDWRGIAVLYSELLQLTGSPVVALNRAVAVAEVDGPGVGLTLLDGVALQGYRYYHAARADLLRRVARTTEAAVEYRTALQLCADEAERRFLRRRLTECERAG
jgi:RNA polymerase sigma-70 factor (ECF subfamily)